jgi:bifunctional non-homologous end joining protein LigD
MESPNAKRKPARARGDVRVAGVVITHSRKVMWPSSGGHRAITKLDLARYYAKVAGRLLPHIARRPLSVVRAPDGIAGEKFFQRHAVAGTNPIKVRGQAGAFLGVSDRKGLVALAQAAALEIHPWGARRDDPDTPERIIFDLDPGSKVDFSGIMEAAKTLRTRLSALGFVPFVKTTGGKGLHVVIAIKAGKSGAPTWKDARNLAKAVCRSLQQEFPNRYTANPLKHARRGKVFLDYLRNSKTATAVAPWSPRARAGAPIAVPLSWNQLRAGLDPRSFTLLTAGHLLSRNDPWAGLGASARSLREAQRKLDNKAR